MDPSHTNILNDLFLLADVPEWKPFVAGLAILLIWLGLRRNSMFDAEVDSQQGGLLTTESGMRVQAKESNGAFTAGCIALGGMLLTVAVFGSRNIIAVINSFQFK